MNRITLVGNLGEDPKPFGSEGKMCRFPLAVTKNRGDSKHTEWFRIKAIGKHAATLVEYLSKGDMVALEGEVFTEKYQDKDGNDKYDTSVLVFGGVEFCRVKKLADKKAADSGEAPF